MTEQTLKDQKNVKVILMNLKRFKDKCYSESWLQRTVNEIDEIDNIDQLFRALSKFFGIKAILDKDTAKRQSIKIYTLVRLQNA